MNRILNFVLLLVVVVAMTSCDGVVGYKRQMMKIDNGMRRYNYPEGKGNDTIHFVVNKRNQILLKSRVNGKEDTLLYDSGAGLPAILFYTKETQPEGMKFYRVPIMGADKKTKVKMAPIPVHIETPICIIDHYGAAILREHVQACTNEISVDRYDILGFEGVSCPPFSIDFTHNQMYNILDMSQVDTTEYVPVKCRLDKMVNVLYIYPIINGNEYECIFDTGNSGGILVKDQKIIDNHTDSDLLYEGSMGKSIGGITENQLFVVAPDNTVEFAGREETVPIVYLGDNLTSNNVGLQYIKRFDWVVGHQLHWDEDHRFVTSTYKLYAKPHSSDTIKHQIDYPVQHYAVSTSDGTLKIITRLIDGNERFEVGDQIISVDGENITEENICYYYELLTETKDWSGFDIKVK